MQSGGIREQVSLGFGPLNEENPLQLLCDMTSRVQLDMDNLQNSACTKLWFIQKLGENMVQQHLLLQFNREE